MKKNCILIAFIMLFSYVFAQNKNILDDESVLFYYTYDSLTDGKLADLSKNNLHGELYRITNIEATGKIDKCFQFVHSDSSRVFIGNDSKLKPNRFTIMSWFKVNTWDGMVKGREILEKTNAYWLVLKKMDETDPNNNTGYLSVGVFSAQTADGGKTNNHIDAPDTIFTNTWYHAASVYNGDSISVYINGVFRGSVTTYSYLFNADYNLVLGTKQHHEGHFINQFDGLLDETCMFNRAFLSSEIETYYSSVAHTFIQPVAAKNIMIFQNPASNEINVHFDSFIKKNCIVSVYNMSGELVYTQNIVKNQLNTIVPNSFSKGVYLIQITDGNDLNFIEKIRIL